MPKKNLAVNDYGGVGRILELPPPKAWTEAARRTDVSRLDHPFDPLHPDPYVEFGYQDDYLVTKDFYANDQKFLHLFHQEFDWDPVTDNLVQKRSYRLHVVPSVLVVNYDWDPNTGNLLSKTFSIAAT
jgi:hypothetical protein